jgi:hypothetical protein
MHCRDAKLQPHKLSILRNSGKQSTTNGKSRAQSLEVQLSKAGRSNPTMRRVSKLPNVVTCTANPFKLERILLPVKGLQAVFYGAVSSSASLSDKDCCANPVIALQYGRDVSHTVPNFAGALRHSASNPLQIVFTIPSLSGRSVKPFDAH